MPYKETHWKFDGDLGLAFDETRVWICLNGIALFRAKVGPNGKLLLELYEDTADSQAKRTSLEEKT